MTKIMLRQGHADRNVQEGFHREPRPYAVNQNFPSQLGTAIDPKAVERFRQGEGFRAPIGPTDGLDQGPGANRDGGKPGSPIRKSGGQGTY
ncbi:MAG TPA: hypothetical protein VGA05_08310 [Candidatus Bathyarchaeia archaeon]